MVGMYFMSSARPLPLSVSPSWMQMQTAHSPTSACHLWPLPMECVWSMLLGPGLSGHSRHRSVWCVASCRAVVQGNLNNFAGLVACQQACIAGTQAPKQAAPSSGVKMPAADELVFLTSALTANAWLTLDATSVRGSTHRIRHSCGLHCWTCSAQSACSWVSYASLTAVHREIEALFGAKRRLGGRPKAHCYLT